MNYDTRRRGKAGYLWFFALLLLIITTVGAACLLFRGNGAAETGATPSESPRSVAVTEIWGSTVYETVEELKTLESGGEVSDLIPAQVDGDRLLLGDLCLVSNDYACTFPEGLELASVYDRKNGSYNVRDTELYLAERIMEPLNHLAEDFFTATGNGDLLVCAGYRSREEQQSLWDNAMANHGEEYTRQYFSLPGSSEHHTGLAVDFSFYDVASGTAYDFDGAGDSAWMLENAWRYGFVQRYPEDKVSITGISGEAWHFRYVGLPHSAIMQAEGLCLEEYLDYLKNFPWDGDHLITQVDDTTYEIWYCSDRDIYVPRSGSYTLSGDNRGGCIVTAITG